MSTPRPIPKGDPIPFAPLRITGPQWPLITSHSQKFEINYEDVNGKLVGTRAGRRFLADRQDGKRWHVGIDLFCYEGDEVVAIGDGKIVAFYRFYTRQSTKEETFAIFVEHEGVVVNYGEVRADAQQKYQWMVGDRVTAGQKIGQVSGTNMIHFECYIPGTSSNQSWPKSSPRPNRLLNPTLFLLDLAAAVDQSAQPTTLVTSAVGIVKLTYPILAEDPLLAGIAAGTDADLTAQQGVKRKSVGVVQTSLNLLGAGIDLGPGGIDLGIFGPRTVKAIKTFQKSAGIKQTGKITAEFLISLDQALVALPQATAPNIAGGIPPQHGLSDSTAMTFSERIPSPGAGSIPTSTIQSSTPPHSGKYKEGSSSTSGSSIETTTYSDGTIISLYQEKLRAVRDGKELKTADGKKVMEARQIRVKQGNQTWVEMSAYCWDQKVNSTWPRRELPVAHLIENHTGFPAGAEVISAYATRFGKFDPQDEGTGSPAHGTVQTNSDVIAASVKKSRLVAFLGMSFPKILENPTLLWSLRVEVYYAKTGRFARVPLGDVGPGESIEAELDLTMALSDFLGGTGKNKMSFRLVRVET